MAGLKLSAILIVTGILCTGCDQFYTNQFASLGLDKPPAPTVTHYEGTNGLANLAADLDSPAVVALLTADPTTVGQIQSYLSGHYDLASPGNAADQTAAALSADLGLKTTQGDDLVNNVVTTIMSNPPSGNIASIIKSVIPPSVLVDTTGGDFADMVGGLLDAKVLYDALGLSIHTIGAPPGMNLGDVAQKAAVAYLMDAVVSAVEALGAPYNTRSAAEAQMFLLVTNQPNAVSLVTVTDPFSPMPTNLQYIFDAAGAPYPA